MILGTKARYAVMAMVDLSRYGRGRPIALAEVAARQEVSLPYLEQIFAKLRREGLVRAVRGPGGGYLLAREAADIRVAAIVEAVNEPLRMTRCDSHARQHGGCMSDRTRCLTHDLWEGLGDHIHGYLHSISLEDVCARRIPGRASETIPQRIAV